MSSSRPRRIATWTGAALVAALIPLVGAAAPSQADATCTSEQPQEVTPISTTVCDDDVPPTTLPVTMQPAPDENGFLNANDGHQVTFTFSGAHSQDTADTDAITYQCQFGTDASPVDSAWQDCTSPTTYDNLADSDQTPYVFHVRALDGPDHAIDATAASTDCPPVTCTPAESDVPDLDATPESAIFRLDTTKPAALIVSGPFDEEGRGSPILTSPSVTYTIDSTEEDATFRCALDGSSVPCSRGEVTVRGLTGGDRTFSVSATDPAGNVSERVDAFFTVPYDLTRANGWRLVKAKGAFAGRVLQTGRVGARVKLPARGVREVRLLAPADPALGQIRIRVGQGGWKVVDLGRGHARRRSYTVRDARSTPIDGPLVIESMGGKPVRVDAIVYPPAG